MLQKLVSLVLVFLIPLSIIHSAFWDDSRSYMLENMWEYKTYALEMWEMIPSLDDKTLERVSLKLSQIESDDAKLNTFVEYLELLISDSQIQTVETVKQDLGLTESEKRKLAREIKNIEWDMKKELSEFLDATISSWNTLSRYEENGDLKAKLQYAVENLIKFDAELNISEYTNQVQVFDQSFDAQIDGSYTTEFWGQKIDLSWESSINLISKWGAIYLRLKNTQLSSTNEEVELELTPLLEKLNELWENNTYLSFTDIDSAEIIWYLESFNGSSLEKEIDEIFSQALFEAYAKNEDGYLLRPTKHFCDMWKKITRVFDPFGGKLCSEKQYEDMLEDFYKSQTQMVLSLWLETKLSITNAQSIDAYEKIKIDFIWKNASLKNMSMTIYDAADPSISYLDVNYTPQKSLTIVSDVPWDLELDMTMIFNRDESVKSMDMSMKLEETVTVTALYDNDALEASLVSIDDDLEVTCSIAWDLDSSYTDLTAKCILSGKDVERELTNGQDSVQIDSELYFNGRSQKNDLSFMLDAQLDEENYIIIDITNTGTRKTSSQKNISAPTNTVDYLEFLWSIETTNTINYDAGYEYTYEEYDTHTESCTIYDNGDKNCSKYYNDRSETCNYTAETDTETCSTYEYGYSIENYEFDDHTTTCYSYDDGTSTCYEYYDTKTRTCNISIEKEISCSEREY